MPFPKQTPHSWHSTVPYNWPSTIHQGDLGHCSTGTPTPNSYTSTIVPKSRRPDMLPGRFHANEKPMVFTSESLSVSCECSLVGSQLKCNHIQIGLATQILGPGHANLRATQPIKLHKNGQSMLISETLQAHRKEKRQRRKKKNYSTSQLTQHNGPISNGPISFRFAWKYGTPKKKLSLSSFVIIFHWRYHTHLRSGHWRTLHHPGDTDLGPLGFSHGAWILGSWDAWDAWDPGCCLESECWLHVEMHIVRIFYDNYNMFQCGSYISGWLDMWFQTSTELQHVY